jgi:general stress protein 26
MTTGTATAQDIEKIAKLIKGMDIGMLTTTDEDGSLRSRPMSCNGKVEFDGDIWFFTYGKSHKVEESKKHPQVNVAFSDIKNMKYVSVTGTAQLVRDQAKIDELWLPELKAWFPEGKETPDIALLKVTAHKAEYWDTPNSIIAHTIALFKVATGQPVDVGENKKVNLD